MKTYYKKVYELIDEGVLEAPMDGNHGEKHPKTSDYVDSGVPFILVPDLKDGIVDLDNCNYISLEQAKTLKKGFSRTGDVLFTHKATIGKVALVDAKEYEYIILTPQVTYYRIKNSEVLDNRYLYYYFSSETFQKVFRAFSSSGGTRDYLGIVAQCKLPIIYPEIQVQRKIADILSKYDDLIANNNKRIKILEQMAENLYKEWFVRFRFPGHETTEFENGIPNGWKSCKLRDIASEVGKSINSDKRDAYNYYLPIDSIPNKSMGLTEVNDIENAESSLHTFKKGDILFGSMRPYFHKVLLAPFDGITRKTCFVINAKNKKYSDWLYLLMYQQSTVAFATTVCVGSTMPYVRPQDLFRMNIILPDENIVQAFSKKVSPILNRIILFFFENQNLIKQRDMLLPRLMSGKLEIKQSQEKVVAFKPKLTFAEFKNGFAAAARKDSGLTAQDMEELYKAYCDDSRDE